MTIHEQLNRLAEAEDYPGIGNMMISILMRGNQEHHPDDDARFLEKQIPGVIRKKFKLPETVTYQDVYLDTHIADGDRADWAKGRFVHLIISAFLLGATRQNLPAPFDGLLKYFRDTAAKQDTILRQASAENANKMAGRSAFAERVAGIQAEYDRRVKALQALHSQQLIDGDELERLIEATHTNFRNTILALGDQPNFRY